MTLETRFVMQSGRLPFKHTHPNTTLYMFGWNTTTLPEAESMATMRSLESANQREASQSRLHMTEHMSFEHYLPDSQQDECEW